MVSMNRRGAHVRSVLLACFAVVVTSDIGAQQNASKAPAPKPGEVKTNPTDGLRYVWIPPGNFTDGCSPGDKECYEDESPPRKVTLTRGFWLGQTDVTQAAYEPVMGYNPSAIEGSNLPVDSVTWVEA